MNEIRAERMVSIIIITYNGAGKVGRLLSSLNALPPDQFEVIIVNDGSSDDTIHVVHSLNLQFRYQLITQENSGRAIAKNKGADEATGDILWFLDDDMRVLPETFSAHLKQISELPQTVSVGSTIEDIEGVTTDIQRYRFEITNSWKQVIEDAPNPLRVENLFITSANFAIRKSLFRQLGGFDVRLRDAEDLDFAYRTYEAQIPIYYNKEAVGFHMDRITCYSYVQRNRQYTKGYAILRAYNPRYYSINKRMHFSKPVKFKKALLSLICRPLFVWLIDHFNIFILLPKKLRYRFYEMLIFGLGRVFTDRKLLHA